MSPVVQLAFASMLGEMQEPPSSEAEEDEEEEEDTLSYVDDEDDEDYKVNEAEEKLELEEEVKKKTWGRKRGRRRRKKKEEEDYDEDDDPSVGDVFALEMKLDRENKKMMKVRKERSLSIDIVSFFKTSISSRYFVCVQERRHRSKLPRALRGLMGEANIRYARGEKEDAIMMCMEIIRQGRKVCVCL